MAVLIIKEKERKRAAKYINSCVVALNSCHCKEMLETLNMLIYFSGSLMPTLRWQWSLHTEEEYPDLCLLLQLKNTSTIL